MIPHSMFLNRGYLFYNVVLVSTIQQCESSISMFIYIYIYIYICMYVSSLLSLPPSPPAHPSGEH